MEGAFRIFLLITFGCLFSCTATKQIPTPLNTNGSWVDICKDWDDWDKPAPPFKIFGNTYYVGTCGISSLLVTAEEGHVLIDGTTAAGAQVVASNIRALGFNLEDVDVILHSHEHFDHVGGIAELQRLTGAKLLASPQAEPVLNSGVAAEADPQAGMHKPFAAAEVSGVIRSGQTVSAGDLSLRALATPGHTQGALSWQWLACDADDCRYIVYADSLSPVSRDGYYFSNHPLLLNRYRKGLEALSQLDCDILLAPHPSMAKMRDLLVEQQSLVSEGACKRYAEWTKKRVKKRLEKEQEELSIN